MAGGAIIGGIIGREQGARAEHKAARRLQEAANMFKQIGIPGIDEQSLALLLPQYGGDFEAMIESVMQQGPSALEGISTDPRLQEAQMSALTNLSEMGETGLTGAEQAALRGARRDASGMAQAKSAQLLDEYARRGMGGSGNELAARLQAGQSGADRASQESDRLMQMAQERALNATAQSGNLAGSIRGQSFNEQADVAKAKDYISQFNTQNSQNVQQRNVGAQNQAGLRNIQERQRVGEAQTGVANQQQTHNKGLIQQKFNNQITKAQGVSGALTNQANLNLQQGANAAASAAAVGAGVDKTAEQIGQMVMMSDVRTKKNVKEMDVSEFLDALDAVTFEYKDPKHGEGKKRGILAQDLEKVMPEAVVDTADGKAIDGSQLINPIMASLAGLNKRLNQMEGK